MKIRIEIKNNKEIDKFLKTLEKTYEIVNVSKSCPNRPPSKLSRIYIEVKENV